jgi:hypothetical protein
MAWRSSVLVLVVVSLFATTLLVAQGPTLTKATLKTTTKDDDRDRDTAIFVQVTENDAKTELAKVAYAEVGGQYGYADHTTHQFNFPPVKMGIPKSQCQNFKFRMGIPAHGGIFGNAKFDIKVENLPIITGQGGNDRWKYDAWLILTFSDGTTLVRDKLDQTSESNGGKLVWDNLQ